MTLSFSVSSKLPKRSSKPTSTLVVFCNKDGKVLGGIDNEIAVRAETLIKQSTFKGGAGESVAAYGDENLVVVGIGNPDKLRSSIAKIAKGAYAAIKNFKSATILWGNTLCQVGFSQFVVAFGASHYRFDTYKTEKSTPALAQVTLFSNKDSEANYESALDFANAIIIAQNTTRDIANEPANVANPAYVAKQAKQLGKDFEGLVDVTVLDEKEMKKLGMGCFLAVSQGSDNEGKIAIIEYFGKTKKTAKAKLKHPIALVGKGVTFDTGGISLKPAATMDEMKFDMGGAAAMLGVARGLCESQLPLDVVIVLALAENMPSGKASRPGDVVTAMNGTTVEILNTDAEGRLVLCDALSYVQDTYHPHTVIDAATLTGSCVFALGSHRSGLFSNDEDLLFALENASDVSGDLVWQMPLGDDYAAQLKSPVADLQNIGGPKGGSVTAACFLQHFIKEGTAWSHLDIAGTAWVGGENKGATGRPVPLLMHYLKSQVQ